MSSTGLVEALAYLARRATAGFAVEEMLRDLCLVAARAIPVAGAGVLSVQGQQVRFVQASADRIAEIDRLQEMLQQGACKTSLRRGRRVVVSDLGEGTRWPDFTARALALGMRSVVAVPLLARGQAWGGLNLYRDRVSDWNEEELATAGILADVAASYLVMAAERDTARAAERELAHQVMHDHTTGLPNRALLFDRLEHAFAAARRLDTPLGVLFIDLDGFKEVNDSFSHAAGDEVLVQVASRLAGTLRAQDTLARLAGDEFVIVCEYLSPDATSDEVPRRLTAVANRIRTALRDPVRVMETDLVVTATIGIAISGPDHDDVQSLLTHADHAMYLAKSKQRNPPKVLPLDLPG